MIFRTDDPSNPPSRSILRARWILIIAVIVLALLDIIEHLLAYGVVDPLLWFKTAAYAVVFYLLGLVLLRPLERSERKREQMEQIVKRQVQRLRQLSDGSDTQGVEQYLVEMPRDFFPAEEAVLYLGEEGAPYNRAAAWTREGVQSTYPQEEKVCLVCRENPEVGFHAVPPDPEGWPDRPGWFSLPLRLGDQRLGMLFMRLPDGYAPQPETVALLDKAALEIAFAADRARMQQQLAAAAAHDSLSRRELARDLHDVLGQNIAYLRMKLEDLSENQDDTPTGADLHRLAQIAGESYTQVRQMLFELNKRPEETFEQQIAALLHDAAQRCPVNFHVEQRGKPFPLRQQVRHEMLFICREALNNIEKHVCGGPVWVALEWGESNLRLVIRDEGPGFDPSHVPDGHYGLQNMHERAELAGGRLQITSAPGQGTAVEVVV